jgi:sugar phosphate isomerase/epimerase
VRPRLGTGALGPGTVDRRGFVMAAGASIAGLILPHPLIPMPQPRRRLDKIGLQLYTVRDLMKRDVEGTLADVARIGYREVEFAGYYDHSAAEVRAMLDRHGLVSPSSHVGFETIEAGWDQVLADCRTVGHHWATVAWIPEERRKTADDWKRIAELFNKAGAACQAAGMRFAYHNHNMEFARVDGQIPFDILLAGTDQALVDFEMDLFWITFGGGDPLAYFAGHPGRFPLVHVKDMAAKPSPEVAPGPVMRDVGKGTIDWKGIFARSAQAGIVHAFVEHDEPGDALASIKASYDYLKALEF